MLDEAVAALRLLGISFFPQACRMRVKAAAQEEGITVQTDGGFGCATQLIRG